jgi:hypothetical protein
VRRLLLLLWKSGRVLNPIFSLTWQQPLLLGNEILAALRGFLRASSGPSLILALPPLLQVNDIRAAKPSPTTIP